MKTHSTTTLATFVCILALVLPAMVQPAMAGGEAQQLKKKIKNDTGQTADNFEASVTGGVISKAGSDRPGFTATGEGTKKVTFKGDGLSIDKNSVTTFTFEFSNTPGEADFSAYWTKGNAKISGNLFSGGEGPGVHSMIFYNPSPTDTLYLADIGFSFQPSFDLFTQDPSSLSYTSPTSFSIAPLETVDISLGTLTPGTVVVTDGTEQFGSAYVSQFYRVTPIPSPEPGSLLLLGSGILGLSGFLRKRLLTRS
jgi:hypothetical protein